GRHPLARSHDRQRSVDRAQALSAFGGANAALVLTRSERATREARRTVFVSRAVHVEPAEADRLDVLARDSGYSADRLARGDGLVRLVIAATERLRRRFALDGAGVIVGHGLATHETNSLYLARVRP